MGYDATYVESRDALKGRIDAAIAAERAAPKPCPDVLEYLADTWNACDFATSTAEISAIAEEVAFLLEDGSAE